MLILNRRPGEAVAIGPDVVLTVEQIDRRRGRVALGVRAPRDVPVDRAEVRQRKRAAQAAGGDPCPE